MNFYKRFVGDMQAKTGDLTLAEFGAYDRLLDHYYSTESALPADRCYAIARAMTREERKAVDFVLGKFFGLTESGYTQRRAEEMIAEAQPKIEAARTNGKRGGRPRKTQPITKPEPSGFLNDNPTGTKDEPNAKASQNQIPPSLRSGGARKRAAPSDVAEQVWDDWLALRKAKSAPVTDTVVESSRAEACKAGMTFEAFLREWCSRGSQGLKADWLRPNERGVTAPTFRERDAANAAARVHEMTNGLVSAKPVGRKPDALTEVFDAAAPRRLG